MLLQRPLPDAAFPDLAGLVAGVPVSDQGVLSLETEGCLLQGRDRELAPPAKLASRRSSK